MPDTAPTLDPRSALLVVDLQRGILQLPPVEVVDALVAVNGRLADAFHDAGLPVVWVHATGTPGGRVARPVPEPDVLPEWFADLDERLPEVEGDLHVHKPRTIGAFSGTDLAERLRALGVTQVVVTGLATGAGVDTTARGAFDAGFSVTVVGDATFDGETERHDATLAHDVPAYGMVASTADVLAALESRTPARP